MKINRKVKLRPTLSILFGVLLITAVANLIYRVPVYVITENSSGKVVYWSFDYNKMLHHFAVYNVDDENGMKGHKYYRWKRL